MMRAAYHRKTKTLLDASRSALTLAEALCSLMFCGGILFFVCFFGAKTVLVAIAVGLLLLPVIMLWGAVYLRAPELAGHLVAVAGLLFLMAALTPYALVQSQEHARRRQAEYYAMRAAQIQQTRPQWGPYRMEPRARAY